MKKRLLALMLAMTMVLGMGTTAMAEEEAPVTGNYKIEDATLTNNSVTINKVYTITNSNTTSPKETFKFTVAETVKTENLGVEAYDENGNVKSYPITVSSVEYDAISESATKTVTISLPAYEAVGVYTYTFSEDAGNNAGVTYDPATYTVEVTVYQTYANGAPDGLAANVNVYNNSLKDDSVENKYEAGSLSVTKKVTGNMADTEEEFTVTVTFTAPKNADDTYKTIGYAIDYIDNDNDTSDENLDTKEYINITDWSEGTATATILLKHGETVTFNNIPYDVEYNVEETVPTDYSETYDDNKSGTIESSSTSTTIINNKESEVDTGVILNNALYIAILGVAVVAIIAFVVRRRRFAE